MAGSSSPTFSISSSKASRASTVSSMRVIEFAGEPDPGWAVDCSSWLGSASFSICECFSSSKALSSDSILTGERAIIAFAKASFSSSPAAPIVEMSDLCALGSNRGV